MEWSLYKLEKFTPTGNYRLWGPVVYDAIGGSVVEELCTVTSEKEPVFCRLENDGDNDDVEGGHGNVAVDSLLILADGVDVTATVNAGTLVTAGRIFFIQECTEFDDEPGQPDPDEIATSTLIHEVGDGGVWADWEIVLTAEVTTFYPWAYFQMCMVNKAQFDGLYTYRLGSPTYRVLSGVQTDLGQVDHFRFVSGSHPYSVGSMLDVPIEALWNWDYAASDSFVLSTEGDDKWKAYNQASSATNPKVVGRGYRHRVRAFHYAARL